MTLSILIALSPIALLILLGHLLRRFRFVDEAFWPQAERLAYFVLLPTLFAYSIGTADLAGVPVGPMALVLLAAIGAVALGLVAANRFLRIEGPVFTSVFQGGIRFNNYVALSAAIGLLGLEGVALGAVANAVIVPAVNVLCALAFAFYGTTRPGVLGVLRSIALNPLILGCAAGFLWRLSGLELPQGIGNFMMVLGEAALPIGLLCVGAALDLRALGGRRKPVVVAGIAKFVGMPALTVLACLVFGLTGPAALTALVFQAMPTASSSYVMARQLGGDAPLMAGIIAIQTLAAAVSVPLTLLFLAPLVGGLPVSAG